MQKPLILSTYMEKGGVGKTTSAASLGFSLARDGKVLLIDGDSQGNLTRQLIPTDEFRAMGKEYVDLLDNTLSFDDTIIEARAPASGFHGIYLLGTSMGCDKLKYYLDGPFRDSPMRIKMIVKEALKKGFDYIIFDLPPTYDFYVKNVLALCDEIIPVIQCEDFAVEGFISLQTKLYQHRDEYDAHYIIRYAIANNFDKKIALHRAQVSTLNQFPFDEVFVCPASAQIKSAVGENKVIQEVKSDSPSAQVFDQLADAIASDGQTTKSE